MGSTPSPPASSKESPSVSVEQCFDEQLLTFSQIAQPSASLDHLLHSLRPPASTILSDNSAHNNALSSARNGVLDFLSSSSLLNPTAPILTTLDTTQILNQLLSQLRNSPIAPLTNIHNPTSAGQSVVDLLLTQPDLLGLLASISSDIPFAVNPLKIIS